MRRSGVRMRLWLGIAVAAVAAVAATGAFGVSGSGTITTIAGTGGRASPGTAARRPRRSCAPVWGGGGRARERLHRRLRQLQGAQGESGRDDHDIRRYGRRGFSGDGGPATSARLNAPIAIAMDGQGNLYIADFNNARVRKVSPGGTITTFAGTGVPGFSGDGGPATSARLYAPHGVAVDGQGNVYIADSYNQRVRKVNPAGTITTIAGGGTSLGDGGSATSARLTNPRGVGADAKGTSTFSTRATVYAKLLPPGRSRRSPVGAVSGMVARHLRRCAPRMGSPWMGRGTSTSLTSTTTVCAR